MKIKIMQGDCLKEIDKIADESVDLIIVDPPYGVIKNMQINKHNTSWDTAINPKAIFEIAKNKLRKNGKLIMFSLEPYTSKLITEAIPDIPFSYRMIWIKEQAGFFMGCKKSPVNVFEDILVFSKKYSNYWNTNILRDYFGKVFDFIGLTQSAINKKLGHGRAKHCFHTLTTQFSLCTEATYQQLIEIFKIDQMEGFKEYKELKKEDDKCSAIFNLQGQNSKRNILEYKKDKKGFHPTQKPVLLLEDLIKTYSNEGDTVLDFTMGSGSTGVAAMKTGRDFIGIELDETYFQIAKERIEKEQISKNKEAI